MEVLLENWNGRVRATSGTPLPLQAEGANDEEALANLRKAVAQRLETGARLVEIAVPADKDFDPLLAIGGIFADDPLFDEWQAAIQENRRQADAREGAW